MHSLWSMFPAMRRHKQCLHNRGTFRHSPPPHVLEEAAQAHSKTCWLLIFLMPCCLCNHQADKRGGGHGGMATQDVCRECVGSVSGVCRDGCSGDFREHWATPWPLAGFPFHKPKQHPLIDMCESRTPTKTPHMPRKQGALCRDCVGIVSGLCREALFFLQIVQIAVSSTGGQNSRGVLGSAAGSGVGAQSQTTRYDANIRQPFLSLSVGNRNMLAVKVLCL